jgi:hypothetical protein
MLAAVPASPPNRQTRMHVAARDLAGWAEAARVRAEAKRVETERRLKS